MDFQIQHDERQGRACSRSARLSSRFYGRFKITAVVQTLSRVAH